MANNIADMLSQISTYQYNPAGIQRVALQTLSDVSDGTLVAVDPTNPFVMLLESGAVMAAGYMAQNQANMRKQYAVLAQTDDDLYYHMSDEDYIGRFATPATTDFEMMFLYDDLIAKMVADTTLGYSKIVIPRNTYFTVADTVYSLQYPIEIRLLSHGGLQIVYDLSIASPLQTLNSNVIDWEIRAGDDETPYVYFKFLVTQFNVTSLTQGVNASVKTTISFTLADSYYYTRVYHQNSDKTWTEIPTTHSQQVYDASTPTAVLVVNGTSLTVSIPTIYTAPQTTGGTPLLAGVIRADVYTTKGAINQVLMNYDASSFSANWYTIDSSEDTTYSAPLNTLSPFIYSNSTVAGGSAAIDFDTLREQVINNTVGPQVTPITNVQARKALSEEGYQLVSDVDNVTNRIFLATRALPTPVNTDLITAAGSTCGTLSFTLDSLSAYNYVVDNTLSLTITPDALYKDVNGVINFVSNAEIAQLAALSATDKAIKVSAGGYRYSPFHYVLDNTQIEFSVRPYYLDGPSVITKLYVAANDSTGLQVSTSAYAIARVASGYTLQVSTSSNDAYKALADSDVQVLLAYTPDGENTQAYLLGTAGGLTSAGERIFNFDLSTNFNVTSDDALQLTQFMMFTANTTLTDAKLTQDFSIIYCTTDAMPAGFKTGTIDLLLPTFLVPSGTVGVTQETLRVEFGQSLEILWARSRSIASSIVYQTYTTAVPAVYTEDVYARDANGSIVTFDANGNPVYTYLHQVGDPVLDPLGKPVILHNVGDPVLDASGAPVVGSTRGITRQVDIMLIEGVYKYGNDTSATNYRDQIVSTLVGWLTTDLETIADELLEKTELFYYPQKTIGRISVLTGNNQTSTIEAGQSLIVTLFVTSVVYNNADLRTQLNGSTVQTVSSALTQTVVAASSILASLRDQYGSDVIDVGISGFGGTLELNAFTILDSSTRASLKKNLVAQSDNTLIVAEDVTINYVLHDTSAVSSSTTSTLTS